MLWIKQILTTRDETQYLVRHDMYFILGCEERSKAAFYQHASILLIVSVSGIVVLIEITQLCRVRSLDKGWKNHSLSERSVVWL